MIKRIFFLPLLPLSIFVFSQNGKVGVGTSNPQQVLHIDAAKNTLGGSTTSNTADDVVISPQGYLGIGNITPTTRLEVVSTTSKNGAIKIADGTQQSNAFLQTDASGLAKWFVQGSIKPIVVGTFNPGSVNSTNTSGVVYRDIKASIVLTPGVYMVNFGGTFKMNNNVKTPYWIHVWLSDIAGQRVDQSNTNISFLGAAGYGTGYAGLMVPGQISKSGNANLITGSSIIKVGNKTPTTTIWVTVENIDTASPPQNWQFTGSNWENYFFAVPLDGTIN